MLGFDQKKRIIINKPNNTRTLTCNMWLEWKVIINMLHSNTSKQQKIKRKLRGSVLEFYTLAH